MDLKVRPGENALEGWLSFRILLISGLLESIVKR
jgi:hypothetical protein